MPINTVMQFVRNALDQMVLPQQMGTLEAFIVPFNPNDETANPGAYIWGSRGSESRGGNVGTVPRAAEYNLASGGNKRLDHSVDVWLVWFGPDASDPTMDVSFPAVIDVVMGRLRNVSLIDAQGHAVDPVSGQLSQLIAVGESMTWEYGPVRAVADQRYLRYDALVTCDVVEVIQA